MNKFYSFLSIMLFIPALCVAEDKAPTIISDSWTMTPKEGHAVQFEEALKAHLAIRTEKGDSRLWQTYVAVTGDKLDQYIVRSCCKSWAEQDSYRTWSNEHLGKHFNETVHPHVKSYNHNFSVIDTENGHWGEDVDASYVGVTMFNLKPGKSASMSEAIKDMSTIAKDNNWPRNWSWFYPVGGSGGVGLATPYANFAAMAPMEESFYQFLTKHLKSEKKAEKMFKAFNSNIQSTHYTIYRMREDLSMSNEKE